MIGNRSEIARMQSDFYRDQFRKIVRWLISALVLAFILIALIVYFILSQPTQKFYGNTVEGRILPMPSTV